MPTSKRIFCKSLLQGTQWRVDVVLTIAPDGLIAAIEPASEQSVDRSIHGVVIPGMPNAHSHAFQRLIAGLTGPQGHNQQESFWSWREAMYQCANLISPVQYTDVASWVFVEMLKAGYTSCAEFHYLHHQPDGESYSNQAEMSERLIEAASISGISMTLLPVLYNSAGFDQAEAGGLQKRFVNTADQYLRLLEACEKLVSGQPLLSMGMAPHSLRAVPEIIMREVLESWPDKKCPVHIHIAEQTEEVASCLESLGARPVEFLLDRFPVNERWCLVHATHLSDDELQLAASRHVCAGLCPTTEADLGDGIFRTAEWLQHGGLFAIGSDSNVRISVAEELRLLEYNERLGSGERNVLTGTYPTCGSFLYQHAAQSGGTMMGQPVGVLEPGYRADLLELDSNHELIAGRAPDIALDSWIFAGDKSMINSVWVAGECVVNRGLHARDDELRAGFTKVLYDVQQS